MKRYIADIREQLLLQDMAQLIIQFIIIQQILSYDTYPFTLLSLCLYIVSIILFILIRKVLLLDYSSYDYTQTVSYSIYKSLYWQIYPYSNITLAFRTLTKLIGMISGLLLDIALTVERNSGIGIDDFVTLIYKLRNYNVLIEYLYKIQNRSYCTSISFYCNPISIDKLGVQEQKLQIKEKEKENK